METKANHILIGGFVLLVMALGFGFLYWINNMSGAGSSRLYSILFHGSVGGLTKASNVMFNGIRVGKVRSLEIYAEDTRKVRVVVNVPGGIPIRSNSRARIAHQGLTGIAVVEITAGSPDAERLVASEGNKYPQIKADQATSNSLMQAAPEVLANANAVFLRLNDLIANNEDSIHNTIKSVESFTKMLEDNKGQINVIISDVKELSGRLKIVAAKIEVAVENISSFVSKDGNSFLEQAKQAAESFRSLAKKLETTVGDEAEGVIKTAKQSMKEFDLFMRDGRRAAQSLDRVLEKIERNPQSFIFGGSDVPEYTPAQ